MSFLPQENALVIGLSSETTVEDWDTEETDSAIWSGSTGAYVVDNLRTVYSDTAGALRRIRDTTLYVPVDWIVESRAQEGQTVIFVVGDNQHARQIMEINSPSGGAVLSDVGPLAGLPHVPATLHLNPAPIEV